MPFDGALDLEDPFHASCMGGRYGVRRNLIAPAGAIVVIGLLLWLAPWRGREGTGPAVPVGSGSSALVGSGSASGPSVDRRVWPLDRGIDEAAEYLSRVNAADGRFEYRLFVDGRHGSPRKYNILRHAGSIYALADYQRTQQRSPEARTQAGLTMTRATRYLLTRAIRPLREKPGLEAVWSDPREEGGSQPTAKLGGAALAMIGILSKIRATEGASDAGTSASFAEELATVQALARFVLFMQEPSGDFHAKYEDGKGYVTDFESLYYPGEAILGLTMLYEVDHDKRWLEAGAKAVAYLVSSRRTTKKLPNDHWLMIATDRLLPRYGDLTSPPLPREEVLEHAVALGRVMMDEQAKVLEKRDDPELSGAFGVDGRTTPAATRLEGLLALEHAIAGDASRAAFRSELRLVIGLGVAFLRRAQVREGIARGGVPMALRVVPETDVGDGGRDDDEARHDKPEGRREQEVRIDYVQHALSAMMRYAAMCEGGGHGCFESKTADDLRDE
jgi:hypothetical protein